MHSFCATLLIALPVLLLGAVAFPKRWLDKNARTVGIWITRLVAVQAIVSIACAIGIASGALPTLSQRLLPSSSDAIGSLGIYFDGPASLMLALVSFVGWAICSYSIRYLDGETGQGRYFAWTALLIGAVSLMAIASNLMMFVVAWVMTSVGLHQLLLFYPDRPAAQRAAWTKFAISRIGDVALIGAMSLIYTRFQTLEFASLFAAVNAPEFSADSMVIVACMLLVFGAITKSAQFPFHTWLPLTLETPTPVSALMHAGIVNGGGYLMIRMSPLVAEVPWAMTTLAIVGAVTACYASVVMLTQTSVKNFLAYSTIAQMGFMILQCGLGAYPAAMLHIIAHSLYKAYAFLNSGSVIKERGSMRGVNVALLPPSFPKMLGCGAVLASCLLGALTLLQIDITTKPGGLLLGFILCMALTNWLGQVLRTGSKRLLTRAFAVSVLVCFAYAVCYWGIDITIASSLPKNANPAAGWIVALVVVLGISGLFTLQLLRTRAKPPAWLHAWHVHASNGFYVEAWLHRTFDSVLSH